MYTRVESSFWTDDVIKTVSEDARTLMLYLFTSPHRNIIGCYRIAKSYITGDLGWTSKRLDKALGELLPEPLGVGRVVYDDDAEIVLVKHFLKHNPLTNPNQNTSAKEKISELPYSEIIFSEFKEYLEHLDKPFAEALRESLGQRLSKQEVRIHRSTKSPVAPAFLKDSKPYLLAVWLRNKILETNPGAKVPPETEVGLTAWAGDIDKMIRIDKRDPHDIGDVIAWAQENDFWNSNILSGKKLRKHFDQMFIQSQKGN